jgi:hypothetical protein
MPAGLFGQGLQRPRLIDVDEPVELLRHAGVEVVTLPLRCRPVDHPDEPLQPRFAQPAQAFKKVINKALKEAGQ